MTPAAYGLPAIRPASAYAVPLALAYVLLVFVLPPKALDPFDYALLVISASVAYVAVFLDEIRRNPPPVEWLLLGALVLLYLALSLPGLLRVEDRLFASGRVLPQAAGLLLMLVSVPAFMHASRMLFVPQARLVPLVVLMAGIAYSVLRWQADEHILRADGLYGVMSPGLMLQFGYFLLVTRIEARLARCLLLALPLPFMLAASNLLIQLLLVSACALPRPRIVMRFYVPVLVVVLLLIAFPTDTVARMLAEDDNTLVRSRLWADALGQIVQHPAGLGFGQSSVTTSALKDPWIRHVFSQEIGRSLEVSNHSTFLDMALRLGWLGLGLLVLLLYRLWRGASRSPRLQLQAVAASGFVIAACAFNPVLESVRATFFFAFALGYLASLGRFSAGDGVMVEAASRPDGLAHPSTPVQRRRELAALAAQRT